MSEATPEQLDAFKQGAVDRYRERGVSPGQAIRNFDHHMRKVAAELINPEATGMGTTAMTPVRRNRNTVSQVNPPVATAPQ